MKKTIFFSTCIALFLTIGLQPLNAQTTPGVPVNKANTKVTPTPVGLPFCDQALRTAKTSLQKDANSKCQTTQACVPCIERQSGIPVYATVIVQPDNSTCKKVGDIVTLPDPGQKDAAFSFDLSQTVCARSGVSLEVIFPDARNKASDFSYEWTVDGKAAGTASKIDCANGTSISVKVTQSSTKQAVTKTMKVMGVSPANSKN